MFHTRAWLLCVCSTCRSSGSISPGYDDFNVTDAPGAMMTFKTNCQYVYVQSLRRLLTKQEPAMLLLCLQDLFGRLQHFLSAIAISTAVLFQVYHFSQ